MIPRKSARRRRSGPATRSIVAAARIVENALVTPIFQTATFAFDNSAAVRRYQEAKQKDRSEYARYGSPGQAVLEARLADLFNTESALVASSGMAAILVTLLTILKQGDHVVMSAESYGGTRLLLEDHLSRFGVRTTFVAPRAEAFIKAIRPATAAVLVECPTNPHLHVPDLPRIAAATRRQEAKPCRRRHEGRSSAARRTGALLMVDPTLAGAFAFDPFRHGADLVLLSLTKYVAGHHDVIAGAVLGAQRLLGPIREAHGTLGALLAPAAIQLVERGLKTLPLRMARHHENGRRIAAFLAGHPKVREVFHPSLASHPDHAIATRLMTDFGGLVSFRIKGNLKTAESFLDRLRIFRIAPSLGGAESLAESVPTMAFWKKTRAARLKLGITDDLIRLAAGLEDPEDLIRDLEQALK
jgi:cystathionine gamma-synthase